MSGDTRTSLPSDGAVHADDRKFRSPAHQEDVVPIRRIANPTAAGCAVEPLAHKPPRVPTRRIVPALGHSAGTPGSGRGSGIPVGQDSDSPEPATSTRIPKTGASAPRRHGRTGADPRAAPRSGHPDDRIPRATATRTTTARATGTRPRRALVEREGRVRGDAACGRSTRLTCRVLPLICSGAPTRQPRYPPGRERPGRGTPCGGVFATVRLTIAPVRYRSSSSIR